MQWLNFHHLLYFWTVAREKTIARACEILHLAQPTISSQIHELERNLGHKLFTRSGRYLELTDIGKIVYRYADEIFSVSREMLDTIKGRSSDAPRKLVVGIVDALPKHIAYSLLEPALKLPENIQLVCREDSLDILLQELASSEIDIVLSDSPVTSAVKIRAFNHLLGESGISILGTKALATALRQGFPQSLNNAPFLMPARHSSVRRDLDHWFATHDIHPFVRAEFDDSALMKVFGQAGEGLFAVPSVLDQKICKQFQVQRVGRIDEIQERYFAISGERKLKHPAVIAISEAARGNLFSIT